MRRRLFVIALSSIVSLVSQASAASAQEEKQEHAKQKKQTKAEQASLTGCVDQQDGRYVLIHDQNRSLIAHLEAEGFPVEGFARHVGHKVTVRGTSVSGGAERPVFKVRSVETVSDACGPQH